MGEGSQIPAYLCILFIYSRDYFVGNFGFCSVPKIYQVGFKPGW